MVSLRLRTAGATSFRAAAYTVQLTAITAVGGLFLGTLLALCHISEKRWLSAPAKLYINLMRAVPLVLVLFWYFLADAGNSAAPSLRASTTP